MSVARARGWASANPALVLFGVALVGAFAVIVAVGWHTTFMRGDWDLLIYRRGSIENTLLEPSGGNLVIGTAAVYRALVHLFGLDPLPFRVLLATLFAISSGLLFATLRRRVGDFAAAIGVGLTLLMGAAYQDILWPLQLGYVVAVACGLGALLALERDDRRADAIACLLLCAGSLTFTAGSAFVVAAAVTVALTPGGLRRAWVPGIPALLVIVWLVIWGSDAVSGPIGHEVADAPLFAVDGFASSLAALLGLSTPQNASGVDGIEWGRALLLVGVVAAVVRLRRLGTVSPRLWAALAGALSFWLIAGAYEEAGRFAESSRYTYIGAVFVLLIVAELAAGLRLRRPAVIVMLVIAAIAVASSANYLGHAAGRYERQGNFVRSGLTALELGRDTVAPDFALDQDFLGTGWAPISAAPYLTALDAYGGSPGFTEPELRRAPLYARSATDRALAAALHISPVSAGPEAGSTSTCTLVDTSAGPATVELAPGGARLDPLGDETELAIGRFSSVFPVELGHIGPGPVDLVIPEDRSTRPWEARFGPGARVRVCPLG